MIDWRDPDGRPDRTITRLSVLRWTVAVSLVAAARSGAVWLALHWRPAEAAAGGPQEAVMIELAPLALAPEQVAPSPQVKEAQPEPVPDPPLKLPEDQPDKPDAVVKDVPKQVEEPTPVAMPQPPVEIPKLPEVSKAAAVLASSPKAQKQEPKKPPPKRTAAPRTSAPSVRAERANRLAAPTSSSAAQVPSASAATWRSALMAHLGRYKQFPANGSQGVSAIAFTIDRSGRVLSARLVRSSGDAALDREAVALARRASPVPAPPTGQGGKTLTISVPIRFDRR